MLNSSRRAIAWPLLSLVGFFVIVGMVWIVLYYGGITPIYNTVVGEFGSGIFTSADATFVLAIAAFWGLILTFGGLWWLWQQAQKP